MSAVVILGVVLLLSMFWALGAFQRLMRLRKKLRHAFGQVDEPLNQRYKLIPRLVENLSHSLMHERASFDAVIDAHNAAVVANAEAARRPADSSALRNLANAENTLIASLVCMLFVAEQSVDYADKLARAQILREFAETEVRLAFTRQIFNEAVGQYNGSLQQFPSSLLASLFRFGLAEKLELTYVTQAGPNEA